MSAPEHEGLRDRPIRTFGRTGGRPLSPRQQQLIETRLDHWRLPQPAAPDFQPLSLFPSAREVWLEIGFGGGEHLVAQAAANPDTGFIGCEPFVEGVAKAIAGIEDNGLANVRLWPDDARLLLDAFAPASIARVFNLSRIPGRNGASRSAASCSRTLWQALRVSLPPAGACALPPMSPATPMKPARLSGE